MRVVWALLAAVLGVVVGYVVTAVLGFVLIPEKPADSGGTAMGIMFSLAPVGAVIGAFAGVFLSLRMTAPDAGAGGGAAGAADDPAPPPPVKKRDAGTST